MTKTVGWARLDKTPVRSPFESLHLNHFQLGRWLNHPLAFSLGSSYASRPVIPKRGEKDFDFAHGGGSGLQRYNLKRAHSAMFNLPA